MEVKARQRIERRIVKRAITDLLKAGYSLNVDNGGDDCELPKPTTNKKAIIAAMFATDDERLYIYEGGKAIGWIWFVYGNDGWDVMSDYTTNLDEVLAGTLALTEKESERLDAYWTERRGV